MTKDDFFQKYFDIESRYFVGNEKSKLLDILFTELKKENLIFSFTDIKEFIEYLTKQSQVIRHQLFLNLIYPILDDEVQNNNIEAIKILIGLEPVLTSYQKFINIEKYSGWNLIDKGLSISPNDIELLKLFEEKHRDYLEYTLHELPTGVLYDSNAASVEQCKELLKILELYEDVCSKLNINSNELIRDCKFYYTSYSNYLNVYKKYNGFKDYLSLELNK